MKRKRKTPRRKVQHPHVGSAINIDRRQSPERRAGEMGYSPRFSYVGRIDGGVRDRGFPLVCGCCGKDIPLASLTFVYYDIGPADFFLVDEPCRQVLSDDWWFKRPMSLSRRRKTR